MIAITISVMVMRIVKFVIVKVRLGSEVKHKEWDARKELRSRLEKAIEEVLGGKCDQKLCDKLLVDKAVIDALRGGEKEELAMLISLKREAFVWRWRMLPILKSAAMQTLGEISDDALNLLLEERNIIEATKAVMVSKDAIKDNVAIKDKDAIRDSDDAALRAAWHNLVGLLGNAQVSK